MKPLLKKTFIMTILLAVILSGCQGIGGPKATPTPVSNLPVKATGVNVAEASVVPLQQINLSFPNPGILEQVLVAEGQAVKAGDVLAHQKGRDRLEAAVSSTKLELLNAQKAKDDLYKNAAVAAARAQLDLSAAKNALDDAQKKQISITYDRATSDNLEAVRAQYTLAQKAVDSAQKLYDNLSSRPEKDQLRAQATVNLQTAKKQRDSVKASLDWLLGFPTDLQVQEREAKLASAQAQVDKAQQDYDTLKNGPDPKDVALVEARINNANAQIKSAQTALSDLELTAPFDGMIVTSDFKPSQFVNPGQNSILLADESIWKIETTDLTELKVVNIKEGEPVTITFDAIPDLKLTGKVERIKNLGVNKQGDITYTVVVTLDKQDPRLRWNMTAIVSFGG